MDFMTLKKKLDNKEEIQNLLVFTGEEKEVQLQYLKRIDSNYTTVDNIDKLPELMSFGSLFGGRKTYVVTNPKITKWADTRLKQLTKKHRLIIMLPTLDKRSAFSKQLKKETVEFKKFNEEQLMKYIQHRQQMQVEAALALALYCNSEVSRIDNELDKLARLGEPITVETVQANVTAPAEDAIFDMIDSIMQKDAHTAFEILTDMLELRESPIKIVSILYTKIKQVFMIQSMQEQDNNAISEKTGINAWVVGNTRELCNRYSLEQLVENLQKVQEYEVKMKTGQVNPEVGIAALIAFMIRS